MPGPWVPDRGDFLWLNFSPHAGREQAGIRPALALSPASFNRLTRSVVVCPVRSRGKGYGFEVVLPPGCPVQGVVLTDQVRSVDWQSRKARKVGKANADTIEEALSKVRAILA